MGADTILAIAAVITAIAGLVKSFMAGKDIKALEKKVEGLEKENGELKKALATATEENRELREQNTILAGVNEEYRLRLLTEIRRR